MKIHFVFPSWRKLLDDHEDLKASLPGALVGSFRMAGLGPAVAAGALPPGHEVTLADENRGEVAADVEADLVCMSCFTPQASRAYALAERFRAHGHKVLAGGIHPTMAPEDTLLHVDAVVEGPVEGLWKEILDDLAGGTLRPRYRGRHHAPFAPPRHDLFAGASYLRSGVVQTARGCPLGCRFCVVPRCYGRGVCLRPVEEILEDLRTFPYPSYFFSEESLMFQDPPVREHFRALMHGILERKLQRPGLMANYPRFLRDVTDDDCALMARAGIRQIYLVLGLQQPLTEELRDPDVLTTVRRLGGHGITTLASFTLGHDGDRPEVDDLIEPFCRDSRANLGEFVIRTPFPGTPEFEDLDREGRLLHRDWSRYNAANVVFQPLHESPDALLQRFLHLWKRYYAALSQREMHRRYVRGFGGGILRGPAPA